MTLLISCPDCQKKVSAAALACPYCGRPNPSAAKSMWTRDSSEWHPRARVILGLAGLCLGVMGFFLALWLAGGQHGSFFDIFRDWLRYVSLAGSICFSLVGMSPWRWRCSSRH
jgi:endogenous inhibitor of DNA gyrase (YacG/DUF329 family)